MSRGLYPVFDPPLDVKYLHGGEHVYSRLAALDQIAMNAALTPLGRYVSPDQRPPQFGPDGMPVRVEPEKDWPGWFSLAAGRESLSGLLRVLRTIEVMCRTVLAPSYDNIVTELEFIAATLIAAEQHSEPVRFRLEVYGDDPAPIEPAPHHHHDTEHAH